MLIGAGEALFLAAVIAALFWLLTPLRRYLESWFARRLKGRRPNRGGRVVVLQRRKDGTFVREDGNGG